MHTSWLGFKYALGKKCLLWENYNLPLIIVYVKNNMYVVLYETALY